MLQGCFILLLFYHSWTLNHLHVQEFITSDTTLFFLSLALLYFLFSCFLPTSLIIFLSRFSSSSSNIHARSLFRPFFNEAYANKWIKSFNQCKFRTVWTFKTTWWATVSWWGRENKRGKKAKRMEYILWIVAYLNNKKETSKKKKK